MAGAGTLVALRNQQHITPRNSGLAANVGAWLLSAGGRGFWSKGSLFELIILSESLQAVLAEVGEADIAAALICKDLGDILIFSGDKPLEIGKML